MSPEHSKIELEENKHHTQSKKQRLKSFYRYMIQTEQLKELSRDQFNMLNRVKIKVNEAKASNFSGFSSPKILKNILSKHLFINKVSTCDTSGDLQTLDLKRRKIFKLQILKGFQQTSLHDKKKCPNLVFDHLPKKRNNPILQNFMSI